MSNPSSDHKDLQALWQAQPQESDPMTLEHIQAISRRLDRQTQWALIMTLLAVAVGFFVIGLGWQSTGDLLTRVTYVLCAAGLVGCAAVTYRVIHLRRDPTEPGGMFLRRRLESNLSMSRGQGMWLILLPMAPGFATLCALTARNAARNPHPHHFTGPQLALNLLPLVLLAAAWCVTLLIIQPRAIRRLRRDLDELNAAMK